MRELASPVKEFPGLVAIPDYLSYPQAIAFDRAMRAAAQESGKLTRLEVNHLAIPGLCACVLEWRIEGLPEHITPENFPATPGAAADALLAWLVRELMALFVEAETVPNV